MILQALKEYYDRKAADPESQIAPPGFEWREVPFVVVLGLDGMPVGISETYENKSGKRRAKSFLLPKAVERTRAVDANLFCDNPEYALGIVLKGSLEQVNERHTAFISRINQFDTCCDVGLIAIKRFLERNDKEELLNVFGNTWEELKKEGKNVTFSLCGDDCILSERPSICSAIVSSEQVQDKADFSICLVSGDNGLIERLHPAIKGVYGAQTSGANIISFNLDAFRSFNKNQGANAPVGKFSAFAYTTALNHLLRKDSTQRMQVGDASVIFWAEQASDFEQQISNFFSEPPKDDPDRGVRAVEGLFSAAQGGTFTVDESESNRFYVLGLSPNASRISIRFWIVDTVAGMAEKIKQHFEDLRIVHWSKDKEVFSLFKLLVSTAVQGKSENIAPNLAGETMRAILEGLPYPKMLLQAVIIRIRAEQSNKDKKSGKPLPNVSYERAAIIKACINRSTRFKNPNIKEELKMSLDINNTNIGYRLGRLFATLEKIQQEANPGINATIRDRFYGAASSTPITVFGNLMRLKNHHLSKLENHGKRIYFEQLLSQIIDGVDSYNCFPPHLNMENQGRFAIGYYHQMQNFYTKKSENNE